MRLRIDRHFRALLVVLAATCLLGFGFKQHCMPGGWTDSEQYLTGCYSDAALAYEGYATAAQCETALGDLCQNQPANWQASIDADRKEYRADQAQGCFAAISASSCDDLSFENAVLLPHLGSATRGTRQAPAHP